MFRYNGARPEPVGAAEDALPSAVRRAAEAHLSWGNGAELDPETRAFYCHTLETALHADIPFLVGGAYAFERYTGIARHTKDIDLFVRPGDLDRLMTVFEQAGYRVEATHPHWLAKA